MDSLDPLINKLFFQLSSTKQQSGLVSIVSASQANDLCCVAGSRFGSDHMSCEIWVSKLMSTNLYRLPKKLWSYTNRGASLFI